MIKVDKRVLHEVDTHQFVTEASDAGFPVGAWPKQFEVDGLGNGMPFNLIEAHQTDAEYRQGFGCVFVRVWND